MISSSLNLSQTIFFLLNPVSAKAENDGSLLRSSYLRHLAPYCWMHSPRPELLCSLQTLQGSSCAHCCPVSEWMAEGKLRAWRLSSCLKCTSFVQAPYLYATTHYVSCSTQEGPALATSRPPGTEPCWAHHEWWVREVTGITLSFPAKTNSFLFSPQPSRFLSLQTKKAVNALLCCPALTHTSSTFIMVRQCCCGRNVKWLCN